MPRQSIDQLRPTVYVPAGTSFEEMCRQVQRQEQAAKQQRTKKAA